MTLVLWLIVILCLIVCLVGGLAGLALYAALTEPDDWELMPLARRP